MGPKRKLTFRESIKIGVRGDKCDGTIGLKTLKYEWIGNLIGKLDSWVRY